MPSDASQRLAPGLHLVATPIGNLGDFSARAIAVLKGADVIACEDTRVTGKLTHAFGIETPLIAYHEHNAERMRPRILARLKAGERVALVSDAGTPLISDPGYKLVREVAAERIPVIAVPGPSAALAALIVSGLPTDRFFFQGFLPAKSGARKTILAEIGVIPATLIVFEAARRLDDTLAEMASVLGEREAAVGRELTKLHEEVQRGTFSALAAHYAAHPGKGEAVIVIAPPSPKVFDAVTEADALDRRLVELLETMAVKEAATVAAGEFHLPRRDVYARALTQRGNGAKDTKDK